MLGWGCQEEPIFNLQWSLHQDQLQLPEQKLLWPLCCLDVNHEATVGWQPWRVLFKIGWLHQPLLEPGNLRWREYLTSRLPEEWKELEKETEELNSKPVAGKPDDIIKYTAKEKCS